jgi:MFS family permease
MTEEKESNVIFNEEYVEPIYKTKTNKISTFTHVVGVVYSSYVLVIIFFASLVRVFNTAILNVTSEGVLHDLKVFKFLLLTQKLSDSFFGAISGPISSIATIFFGIVVGRSSDLYSRKYLFLFCVCVWTIFQVLTGFSQNYWHLMFCKIGSAAGMGKNFFRFKFIGGLNPINFSLITDYFQPSRRPIAFGLQGTSLIFGIGGAFLFGALATENSSNWRELFFFSAIPGAVVAVLIFFTVNEPERGALDERKDTKKSPDITNLSIFLAKRPSLWLMCLGGAFGFLGANAINTFNTIFYRRVHGISANELSSWLSWISPLGGLGGSVFGAILCVIAQKFTQRGYALVCLFGSLMSIPFQLSSLLVPNPYLSLLLYLPASFVRTNQKLTFSFNSLFSFQSI